jgi:hypothetical protein
MVLRELSFIKVRHAIHEVLLTLLLGKLTGNFFGSDKMFLQNSWI